MLYTNFCFCFLTASFVKTCLKSDPEFDVCSRQAVQQLFNALGPGNTGQITYIFYLTQDINIYLVIHNYKSPSATHKMGRRPKRGRKKSPNAGCFQL